MNKCGRWRNISTLSLEVSFHLQNSTILSRWKKSFCRPLDRTLVGAFYAIRIRDRHREENLGPQPGRHSEDWAFSDRTLLHKWLNGVRKCIWHSNDRASLYILIIKANEMHYFSYLFDKVLYMFRTGPLSIIRSISTLYTRNRYLSC